MKGRCCCLGWGLVMVFSIGMLNSIRLLMLWIWWFSSLISNESRMLMFSFSVSVLNSIG